MRKPIAIGRSTLGVLLLAAACSAATDYASQAPVELVRQTVQNELNSNNRGVKFRFKDHKETVYDSQTKMVIETRQATAGILVAINGQPLTAQQRADETARLDNLVNNPEELRKKQKAEREDADRTNRIMRALPDAFIYEHDGTATGKSGLGNPGDELVRLKFRPNPNYVPPTHAEQVLTGMQGFVLIDAKAHRIAQIDGTLIKDVGFGWGILGRLDKGGRFVVVQGAVAPGDWEVTRMDLDFKGKELLFKKINIKSNEVFSDFQPVPSDLNFAQAVEMLKKECAEWAENRQQNGNPQQDHNKR